MGLPRAALLTLLALLAFAGNSLLCRAALAGGHADAASFTALRLGAAGAKVIVVDRNTEAAKAVAAEAGGRAEGVDLADPAAVDRLDADVDIVVNNAGLQHVAPVPEFAPDRFTHIHRVMVEAPFLIVRRALPHMYARGWGRIINISSVNGEKGEFGQTNYSAAKAGMHGFTMALAQEVAGKGVTVNTVSPGYIATDMVKAIRQEVLDKIIAGIPVKRLGTPEEIASIVAWLAGEDSGFTTGADFSCNGGLHMG